MTGKKITFCISYISSLAISFPYKVFLLHFLIFKSHRFGEWLIFEADGSSRCEDKKYCKRFDNWHWWSPHQRCYRQFSQGPCKKGASGFFCGKCQDLTFSFSAGKLFYLDPDAGGTGCHCRPDWSVYYWGETGECFEQVRYEKTIEFPTKWQRKKA